MKKTGIKKEYENYNTLHEINDLADSLLNNNEQEKIKALAEEKGLDPYMAEMFLNGELPALVPDAMTGALGKLDAEVRDLDDKNVELGAGIAEYMKQQVMENEKLASAVMDKDKHLEDVCKQAWKEAESRKKGNCAYIPPFEIFQMAKAYYLERQEGEA